MRVRSQLSTLMGKYRYTITDVHAKTGLARSTVSNLYNDRATRINYDTISRLCKLFNCKISELLSLEKEQDTAHKMEVHNEYNS